MGLPDTFRKSGNIASMNLVAADITAMLPGYAFFFNTSLD
jgi:hypothetical protein